MNNARRKEIARAIELLQQAREIVSEVAQEERDAFDALPESMQNGERGQAASEAADAAENAESSLEEAISSLEEASR